ncbi:MAG: protoglobin family protein [Chloroflexi bacterium]|nr:protoglobin family protein [Chloroflexota bacterium]
MSNSSSTKKATFKGWTDAGSYFRAMAEFVGFRKEDIAAIRETRFIIEKHIPKIVAKFYDHLLRYPPTRKYFLKIDGSLDRENLQLRMTHLTNFWRRTASGEFDDDYAQFVEYVGRAHTSQGADPKIYIPERYVIGQVGFMQHAISEALSTELHEIDPTYGGSWAKSLEPADDGDPGDAFESLQRRT